MVRMNFWSGLAVSAFAMLCIWWIIPAYAGRATFASMPPDLLPKIAAWIMLVSGVAVVGTSIVEMRRDGITPFASEIDWGALFWSLWPFVYVGVFIWLMNYIKVIYIGPPMIALMLILLGARNPWSILAYSLAPVALVYFLAVYLMRVGVV